MDTNNTRCLFFRKNKTLFQHCWVYEDFKQIGKNQKTSKQQESTDERYCTKCNTATHHTEKCKKGTGECFKCDKKGHYTRDKIKETQIKFKQKNAKLQEGGDKARNKKLTLKKM